MANPFQPDLPGQKTSSNSRKGKDFEAEIEAVNDYYRLRGIVDVVKNAEKWVVFDKLKPGQTAESYFRAVPSKFKSGGNKIQLHTSVIPPKNYVADNLAVTANGWVLKREDSDVDFSGGNDEAAYAFDAKESKGDYISMDNLKPHQIQRLKVSRKCRCVAGFLIKFTDHNRVFFAPIKFVIEKEELRRRQTGKRAASGTASISIKELEIQGREVFQDKVSGLWDWFRYISIRNMN